MLVNHLGKFIGEEDLTQNMGYKPLPSLQNLNLNFLREVLINPRTSADTSGYTFAVTDSRGGSYIQFTLSSEELAIFKQLSNNPYTVSNLIHCTTNITLKAEKNVLYLNLDSKKTFFVDAGSFELDYEELLEKVKDSDSVHSLGKYYIFSGNEYIFLLRRTKQEDDLESFIILDRGSVIHALVSLQISLGFDSIGMKAMNFKLAEGFYDHDNDIIEIGHSVIYYSSGLLNVVQKDLFKVLTLPVFIASPPGLNRIRVLRDNLNISEEEASKLVSCKLVNRENPIGGKIHKEIFMQIKTEDRYKTNTTLILIQGTICQKHILSTEFSLLVRDWETVAIKDRAVRIISEEQMYEVYSILNDTEFSGESKRNSLLGIVTESEEKSTIESFIESPNIFSQKN